METNSFGEDLVVKTRKPYTITKLREKWTEEEHNRFLEALKLYGRAWQRIEEHIGTKTAIQIRSHAKKFFTKLEKEAAATGTHLGRADDIAIPPPRPKKKPSYPYPRKTGFSPIPPADDKTLKTMKNPPPHEINKQEASVAAKSLQQSQECSDDAHSSVVLNLFRDKNKASKNQSTFIPSSERSSLTIEVNTEQGLHYHEGHEATVDNGDPPSNASPLMNHPIPAAMSYISHPFPTQDFYSSFLSISPAFPTQIASTLLQNPAVHAAACMAAAPLRPSEEINSSNAIAAATVAAASAWWAANGLIPLFPPLHPSAFPSSPQEKMEDYKNSSSSMKIENKLKVSQKNDRSSCGSNAASSSEIEADAVVEENGKTKYQNLPVGEFNAHRVRSSLCFNETWREVSHEGRLAFQALFARDILPQSFATQLDEPEMGLMKEDEIKHGNIKVWRTGFKPYKRCSEEVEVHESSANDEKTCNKKIRVQGEV